MRKRTFKSAVLSLRSAREDQARQIEALIKVNEEPRPRSCDLAGDQIGRIARGEWRPRIGIVVERLKDDNVYSARRYACRQSIYKVHSAADAKDGDSKKTRRWQSRSLWKLRPRRPVVQAS